MKVRWVVLCDFANMSKEGKLNLMGVFDQITSKNYPAIHPSMFLVIRFDVDPAEFGHQQKIIVKLADEDGKKILEASAELTPNGEGGRGLYVDNVLALQNVVFPHEGRYSVDVLVNNNAQGHVGLNMLKAPISAGPAQ